MDRKIYGYGALALVATLGIGGAYLWYLRRPKKQKSLHSVFNDIRKEFELPVSELQRIRDNFIREMKEGLEENSQSSLKMLPTFVTRRPTGVEEGIAYALDIGGSNLRVLKVFLDGKGSTIVDQSVVQASIPIEIQRSKAETLFNFIAENVAKLISTEKFGFTFSFPLFQSSINSGYLISWTKGFTASGVVNEDVVELLSKACERINIHAKVNALINDTVGTMLTGSYQQVQADCCMGLILGTGSNACYWEKVENIKKFDNSREKAKGMIINIESGNFGSRPSRIGKDLPLNQYDIILNLESNNKDQQLLEKQISGMYLGELFRLVLKKLIKEQILINAREDRFPKPYRLDTKDLSDIEEDKTRDCQVLNDKLESYGIINTTVEKRQLLHSIIHHIAERAALLSATQIAACLTQMGKDKVETVVAVDGSVFEKYPGFALMMESGLSSLGCDHVSLVLAKDGSGVGAALASFMMK